MASTLKTIGEFEKAKGCIIVGADTKKKITEEEFDAIPHKSGVNHEDRIAFLTANGYELTRENMINPNLSAVVNDETQKVE